MLNNIDYENRIKRKNKLNLVLCEIYNKYIHGDIEVNDVHYLTLYKFMFDLNYTDNEDNDDEHDEDNDDEHDEHDENNDDYTNLFELKNLAKKYRKKYQSIKHRSDYSFISQHSVIRNYKKILESPDYFKPEIGECIYLDNGTCVCILKTFWIRIIQRAWKKVFLKRKNMLIKRMSYYSIVHREIHGNWPKNCQIMPGLKGLLFAK